MNTRKLPIAGVAVALGLTVTGRAPGRVSPCPACNRGPGSDGRPVVGIARDGRAWRCHACGKGGDALDLVCFRVGGAPWGDLAADVRDEARARAAELGLCDPDPRADPATVRPVRPLPAVAVAPPAVALDPDEVASWWARCEPATDPDVCAWLRARGLAAVLDRPDVGEIVRALPVDEAPLPRWARLPVAGDAGRPVALEWNELDLLATVRTFDTAGRARGVRARWTGRLDGAERGDRPKEAGAAGAAAAGLLLADPVALDVLAGRAAPDVVLVVEGCPDWLAACGAYPGAAVLGVPGSGAWAPAWGPALARGAPAARYVVATHADVAGDGYAAVAVRDLEAARLDVCRWRPPVGLDLADLAQRGALPSLATLTRRPGALVDAPTSAPVPEPAPGPPGPSGAPMREYEGPPDPPLDVYAPGGPVATKGPTPTKADPSPATAAPRGPSAAAVPIGALVGPALARMRRRSERTERPVPLPWWNVAEHLGGGLWPGLHVLVGGTGTGKTQLVMQAALEAARAGVPVLYVALELGDVDLVARWLALLAVDDAPPTSARVPWSDLFLGTTAAGPWLMGPGTRADALQKAADELATLPIKLVFAPPHGWPADALRKEADALRDAYPEHMDQSGKPVPGSVPMLVVLDFLQIVGEPEPIPGVFRPTTSLRERIGMAAYQGRSIARDLGAAVVIVSSTARENYKTARGDDSPWLGHAADLVGMGKESGEIEYSADSVMFMVREPPPNNDGSEQKQTKKPKDPPPWVHIAVAKVRAGRPGWTGLRFNGHRFIAPATGDGNKPDEYREHVDDARKKKKRAAPPTDPAPPEKGGASGLG